MGEDVLALANLKLLKETANRMSELSNIQQLGLLRSIEKNELECISKFIIMPFIQGSSGIVEAIKLELITLQNHLK